jgi:hypothetical protein
MIKEHRIRFRLGARGVLGNRLRGREAPLRERVSVVVAGLSVQRGDRLLWHREADGRQSVYFVGHFGGAGKG